MAAELKSEPGRVLYLYGITETVPAEPIAHTGVDLQSSVIPIDCDGVVCWTSQVSALEFGENLATNMENLDWLANASIAHQRVVAAIAREADILPARFGTVFRSAASLKKHIRARTREIIRDFKRVKDADEWGIKVFAIRPVAAVPTANSGRDYLKAKAALLPRRRSQTAATGDLAEFEQALGRVAEASAKSGTISTGQRGLTFQTSLLVKRRKQKQLQSVLGKFSQRWSEERKIECTGPWPPYSFVSRDRDTSE